MTAFNVAMLLTADSTQARRELKGAEAEVQKFGAAARQAGNTAAAGFDKAGAEILQFRRASTGATSNLVAQFNDVGQMLAAGQSPLLLAAQQGTQISQVLGPLGAAGAVRALGSAFLGMLSPVNLAVFGAVAALGLLGTALRGLLGETQSVEDAIGELEAAARSWRDAAKVGSDDLLREFGRITPEIVALQREMTNLALTNQLLKAAEAAAVLGGEFDRIDDWRSRSGDIAKFLDVEPALSGRRNAARSVYENPLIGNFDRQFETLATSPDLDAQIEALRTIRGIITENVDLNAAGNERQREFLASVQALERELLAVKAAQDGIGSAQQVSEEKLRSMIAGLEDERRIKDLIRQHGEDSLQVEAARVEVERQAVQEMLAASDASGELKRQFLAAWEAANGVQAASGDFLSTLLDVAGAGEDTRRAIEDAWAAITGAAGETNVWAGAMSGVAAEVRGIWAALGSVVKTGIANASRQIEIEALRSGQSVAEARRTVMEAEIRREGEARLASARSTAEATTVWVETETRIRGVELDRQIEAERRAAAERDRAATRGASGRSGSRAAEVSHGQRLIATLEREQELLRETDPVQKEIIRNREALAQLMGAERARAEELIGVNVRLREQQAAEKQGWDDTKQAAFDALDGLIRRGESAAEVMANLADWIAEAFLQSALLGTGPLAGLFGGQGTGLLDMLGKGLGIPGVATGGLITGPGGPTSDSILARLSNGEFVVNAAATARHRPLLEAINTAPRFATGGIVGGGANSPFAPGGGAPAAVVELRLSDDLDARIAETSQAVSVRVTRAGIQEYDRKAMPKKMRAVQADPRRVG
jgi:hypothetical protein